MSKTKWTVYPLSECCNFISDGNWIESKDQSANGIRLIQTGNIGIGRYLDKIDTGKYISQKTFNQLNCIEVFSNDILISRLPKPVGRACIVPELGSKLITAVDCTIVRVKKELCNNNFLLFYLTSDEYFLQVNKYLAGATRERISRKNLEKIKIPLPPLVEQERIVKIIDTKMKCVEIMKQAAQEQQKIVENLFLSYLQTMVVGTKSTTSTIGDFCALLTGGTPTSTNKEYYENGNIPWLVSGDIHKETVFDCEQHITELGMMNSNAKILPVGSVLIALAGQGKTRGTVAMLEMDNATCNQSLVSISPNQNIAVSKYIYYNLRSRYNEIRALTGDMERSGLSITRIKKIKINLPNINEQREIVLKIDTKSVAMNNIKKAINERLSYIDALPSSILRQAFNGEL